MDLETVIHAFISTRLDYCNSLYLGITQSCLSLLQMVQNAAGTKKRESITPVLISLHWLPIEFWIQFKVLLFVYKSMAGLAPSYLSDLLSYHVTNRPLRSSNSFLLSVPMTRLKLKGGVCIFSKTVGPVLKQTCSQSAVRGVSTHDARRERSSVHMTDNSRAERRQKDRDGR